MESIEDSSLAYLKVF